MKILYAEDDENDVFLMTRAFRKADVEGLQVVTNGREAVDYLTRASRPDRDSAVSVPRLVLLDLNMPFLSGLEVLAWIREQPVYASLAVVMFTSSNQEKDIATAYASGVSAYLMKPSAAHKLVDLVKILQEACVAEPVDTALLRTLPAYQPRPSL